MSLNYAALVLDLRDGAGSLIVKGTARLVPSTQLTDAGVEIVTQAPLTAVFGVSGSPLVHLLATDSAGPQPAGWNWAISFEGVPGSPAPFSFSLPYLGGATQYLSALVPVPGFVPLVISDLDGGSAATGGFPVGSVDGGSASG